MPYETTALRGDVPTFGIPELEPLHLELLDYGLCMLRGNQSTRMELVQVLPGDPDDPANCRIVTTHYRESDPLAQKRERDWTGAEIEDARNLHRRIIRLPLKAHSLTIMVFYGEACAAGWGKLEPHVQRQIIRDLTYWPSKPYGVNARLRNYARETGQEYVPIREADFMPIMLRGMRILMNSERMLS